MNDRARQEARRLLDMNALVGSRAPVGRPFDELGKWGENVGKLYAAGMAAGMADVESGRYARRQRMYGRWNRIKQPVINALAWVFGR